MLTSMTPWLRITVLEVGEGTRDTPTVLRLQVITRLLIALMVHLTVILTVLLTVPMVRLMVPLALLAARTEVLEDVTGRTAALRPVSALCRGTLTWGRSSYLCDDWEIRGTRDGRAG